MLCGCFFVTAEVFVPVVVFVCVVVLPVPSVAPRIDFFVALVGVVALLFFATGDCFTEDVVPVFLLDELLPVLLPEVALLIADLIFDTALAREDAISFSLLYH